MEIKNVEEDYTVTQYRVMVSTDTRDVEMEVIVDHEQGVQQVTPVSLDWKYLKLEEKDAIRELLYETSWI